jgi:hypothetical protein
MDGNLVFPCPPDDIINKRAYPTLDLLWVRVLSRWNGRWMTGGSAESLLIVVHLFYSPLNSLTAIRVLAGTKNSRPVGFYSRNSRKSTVNPNTTIPQICSPGWCRSPLIRRGIYGSTRSNARNIFRRGWAGGWLKVWCKRRWATL